MCRPNWGAAPTGVRPLPGLHFQMGILPAVDTAGYKSFAAPRLHYKPRTPPSAGWPSVLGCIEFRSLSAFRLLSIRSGLARIRRSGIGDDGFWTRFAVA